MNGIVNELSEELGYVSDVTMTNIRLIGLHLGTYNDGNGTGDASNSGPYSNIYISGSGKCVVIEQTTSGATGGNGTNGTRGFHGLTCVTGGSGPVISLDAPNNSMEDVYMQFAGTGSSPDGILVGSNQQANGNVLLNITGNGLGNVVHIGSTTTMAAKCPGGANVCDLTILGVTALAGGNSIQDDLLATTLSDGNVGMYVIGEPVAGGTSRFTTSLSVPTWQVGTTVLAPRTACTNPGALYSCVVTGSAGCGGNTSPLPTLWGCAGGVWTAIATH